MCFDSPPEPKARKRYRQAMKFTTLFLTLLLTKYTFSQTRIPQYFEFTNNDSIVGMRDTIELISQNQLYLNQESVVIVFNKTLHKSFLVEFNCQTDSANYYLQDQKEQISKYCDQSVVQLENKSKSRLLIKFISDTTAIVDFIKYSGETYGIKNNLHYIDTCVFVKSNNFYTALHYQENLRQLDFYHWFDLFIPTGIGPISVIYKRDENGSIYLFE